MGRVAVARCLKLLVFFAFRHARTAVERISLALYE